MSSSAGLGSCIDGADPGRKVPDGVEAFGHPLVVKADEPDVPVDGFP